MSRRLALVTPLPPARSGIADYSVDLASALGGRFELDFFAGPEAVERERLPPGSRVFPAGELLERQAREPYALVVYQLGNSVEHAPVYELLPRLPGLLVLHDLVLHHSRARTFLESPAARAYAADPSSAALRDAALAGLQGYRAEVAYAHPEAGGRLVEAQLNSVGALLPYAYPLFRLPVECARLVAVHNAFMERSLREAVPDVEVVRLPMPVRAQPVEPARVAALRARLGFAPEDVVVGVFGLLTPEKRALTVARALARARTALPRLRLLLVGPMPEEAELRAQLERLGLGGRAVLTGRVPFEELPAHMEAADLAAHLRYPTARETSAALLRLLAQGRPTLISDLEHQSEIPDEAVVRLDVSDEEGELTRALLRLGERPDLRAALGRRAAEHARREHSFERAGALWGAALERAAAAPAPRPRAGWPAAWRP